MIELESFHAEEDRFFATEPQSPLMPEQKQHFKGLHCFPDNPAPRFSAGLSVSRSGPLTAFSPSSNCLLTLHLIDG